MGFSRVEQKLESRNSLENKGFLIERAAGYAHFKFTRLPDCLIFEHKKSDTLFVMRLYRANEAVGEADLISVRHQLDYRGFVERDDFEQALLAVKA